MSHFPAMGETVYYFVDAVEANKPLYQNMAMWTALGAIGTLAAAFFSWRAVSISARQQKLLAKEAEERRRPAIRYTGHQWNTSADTDIWTIDFYFENVNVPIHYKIEEKVNGVILLQKRTSLNYLAQGQKFTLRISVDSTSQQFTNYRAHIEYGPTEDESLNYIYEFVVDVPPANARDMEHHIDIQYKQK